MRFLQFINEKYLRSDFKFGFEFECIDKKYKSDLELKNIFNNLGNIEITDDSSIKAKEFRGVEIKVGPLYCTPLNIQNCINTLTQARKSGLATNKSCGFHVHTSWPDLDEVMSAWVIVNLAADGKWKKFTKFKDTFDFINADYASNYKMANLNHIIQNSSKDFSDSYKQIVNASLELVEKYNVFHLHSLGTIEWRGPRDFMNTGSTHIHDFFIFYLELVNFYRNALDTKNIGWINFDEFKKECNKAIGIGGSVNKWIKKKNELKDVRFHPGTSKNAIKKLFKVYPEIGKCKFKDIYLTYEYDGSFLMGDGKLLSGKFKNLKIQSCYITEECSFENCSLINCEIPKGVTLINCKVI